MYKILRIKNPREREKKSMIVLRFRMVARPDKRREFWKTLSSLNDKIRRQTGCLKHYSYWDMENRRAFCVEETWQNREAIEQFFKSELFTVLEGAIKVLCEPPEIQLSSVASLTDMNALQRNWSDILNTDY